VVNSGDGAGVKPSAAGAKTKNAPVPWQERGRASGSAFGIDESTGPLNPPGGTRPMGTIRKAGLGAAAKGFQTQASALRLYSMARAGSAAEIWSWLPRSATVLAGRPEFLPMRRSTIRSP